MARIYEAVENKKRDINMSPSYAARIDKYMMVIEKLYNNIGS